MNFFQRLCILDRLWGSYLQLYIPMAQVRLSFVLGEGDWHVSIVSICSMLLHIGFRITRYIFMFRVFGLQSKFVWLLEDPSLWTDFVWTDPFAFQVTFLLWNIPEDKDLSIGRSSRIIKLLRIIGHLGVHGGFCLDFPRNQGISRNLSYILGPRSCEVAIIWRKPHKFTLSEICTNCVCVCVLRFIVGY